MLKLMGVALVSGLVLGCSGNSSSSRGGENTEETGTVSGQVGAASESVRVTLVDLTFEGQPSRVEADSGELQFDGIYTATSATGSYLINLTTEDFGSNQLLISTDPDSAGTYLCELPQGCGDIGYKGRVAFRSNDLFPYDIRAGVGKLAAGMSVNINWVTDLASSLATSVFTDEVLNVNGKSDRNDVGEGVDTHRTGFYNEYTIELANLHVSKLFSVSDIISVTPIGPSKLTQATNLKSAQLEESLFYGALISAFPLLIENRGVSYSELLGIITDDLLERQGQLLQKDSLNDVTSLDDIFSTAENLLRANINYFESLDAEVPSAARAALNKIINLRSTLILNAETDVYVDVPAELASWQTNIEKAKAFIEDLSAAIKNFTGKDANQASFIDPNHSARLTQYFDAHENAYDSLSPKLFNALQDVMFGVQYLTDCINNACPTSNLSTSGSGVTVTYSATAKKLAFSSGSLTLSYFPVKQSDSDVGPYAAFDIELSDGSLTLGGETFSWKRDDISDATSEEQPYVRLVYNDEYSVVPPFLDFSHPNHEEPTQITVVWPNLSFTSDIGNGTEDSGEHEITVLFETNLVGVSDPFDDQLELRYNPLTVVFWLKSVFDDGSGAIDLDFNVPLVNTNALQMELRTSNALIFYPPAKWPDTNNFFDGRDDPKATISDMLSIYRGTETVGSTVVDIYDEKLITSNYVSRVRVYPYDSSQNVTLTQACFISTGIGNSAAGSDSCSDFTRLAGDVSLTSLLETKFSAPVDSVTYQIPSHGNYLIDLNEGADTLLREETDTSGSTQLTFEGLSSGIVYGPFTGTLSEPIELGIDFLNVLISSQMVEGAELRPIFLQSSLQRSVQDQYVAEVTFHTDVDYFVEQVPIGNDAQYIKLQYVVTKDENLDFYVEVGTFVIFRSDVVLSEASGPESAAALISTRVEYPEGDQQFGCGIQGRDELVAGDSCEALAYLRIRGALVGTVREERPNVFVVRFVDGSWMVLGE